MNIVSSIVKFSNFFWGWRNGAAGNGVGSGENP